jgi:hypothetical protein
MTTRFVSSITPFALFVQLILAPLSQQRKYAESETDSESQGGFLAPEDISVTTESDPSTIIAGPAYNATALDGGNHII